MMMTLMMMILKIKVLYTRYSGTGTQYRLGFGVECLEQHTNHFIQYENLTIN